jgi:hypothetical protein
VPVVLGRPIDEITKTLFGIDVVISTIPATAINEQIALATAAKAAGVGRFVPSFFGPATPPRGVLEMREKAGLLEDGPQFNPHDLKQV